MEQLLRAPELPRPETETPPRPRPTKHNENCWSRHRPNWKKADGTAASVFYSKKLEPILNRKCCADASVCGAKGIYRSIRPDRRTEHLLAHQPRIAITITMRGAQRRQEIASREQAKPACSLQTTSRRMSAFGQHPHSAGALDDHAPHVSAHPMFLAASRRLGEVIRLKPPDSTLERPWRLS